MKIELHLLQNFAPSNLNRDDTGAPKDCEFGGVRRARISSQCFKRSIRQAFELHHLFGDETKDRLAARTKRLVVDVAEQLAKKGRDPAQAFHLVAFALQSAKLKMKDEKTQYLLFVPRRLVGTLAELVDAHWSALASAAPAVQTPEPQSSAEGPAEAVKGAKKKGPSKAQEKAAAKDAVPKDVTTAVMAAFEDTSATPDLALFGRMIADNPDWNVDAACQVAHALSTHRATMEFDFYTAVDDLKSKDETGSDMMGTVAYQSACFYRYSCLDMDALALNLDGTDAKEGRALTKETLDAYLRATAFAVPTGKQNSMAAQNLPSYLVAVVRKAGAPQSLANAFVKPVKPTGERSLVEVSVDALEAQLAKGLGLWGDEGVTVLRCGEVSSATPASPLLPSFSRWVDDVVATWECA
jgi:CRISPR system Cascade subunit CasC